MKKILILSLLLNIYVCYSQEIKMEVENSYINMGEWTTFTVTASGNIKSFEYYTPTDVDIIQIGKNTYFNSVNGVSTKSYSLTYKVTPKKEGTLKLPVFYIIDSNNNKIETEEKVIYVTPLKDDNITKHNMSLDFETDYVKLYIDLPQRNLYIGEAIPVTVTAYFNLTNQPGIDRAPYIKTGSFILDTGERESSNKPERIINGQKWVELNWNSFLTPLKSGELDLQLAIDSYIIISNGSNSFFSNSEKKSINTTSKAQKINILPIPLADKPANFTGAVGEFNLNCSLSNNEINVGDPITLTIDLYGSGNFQRIGIPVMQDLYLKDWKLYPESSTYTGTNGSNYRGVKQFQQILSPKNNSINQIPIFSMTYFNPITEKFEILETEALKITVTGNISTEDIVVSEAQNKFIEAKEIVRHKKSGNPLLINSFKDSFVLIISICLSLLFLFLTLVIYINRVFKRKFVKQNNTKNKLLKSNINKLEHEEKYLDALYLYKELIIDNVSKNMECSKESITTFDLDNPVYKNIFTTLDEVKYCKKTINSNDYYDLIKGIEEELK
ncbi:MAG: BatD family protein [Spirochaetales bacterium]|nr:BatD family protein [Spirochaetales bacterium]